MSHLTEIIELTEFQPVYLDRGEFSDEEAQKLYKLYNNKVQVEPPSFKNDNRWELTSLGWVGYICLSKSRGISLQSKVPLGNLFQMLEYAYDLGSFKLLEGLYDCESIIEFFERLAIILSKKLLGRIRQGIYKAYLEETEELSFVRGRIDMDVFFSRPVKSKLVCTYENHTPDIDDNRIIAWTLYTILRSGICSERSVTLVRKAEKALHGAVQLKSFTAFDCINRTYNRLNSDYNAMHKLCRFFLENSGPTQNIGDTTMIPFMVDMARLYELFVARWLEQNLPHTMRLKSQEGLVVDKHGTVKMVMDLVLYDRETGKPKYVLDTKYKAHETVKNEDYYQVNTYAGNIGCSEAILIYPKAFDIPFVSQTGNVRVRSSHFGIEGDLDNGGKCFLESL